MEEGSGAKRRENGKRKSSHDYDVRKLELVNMIMEQSNKIQHLEKKLNQKKINKKKDNVV